MKREDSYSKGFASNEITHSLLSFGPRPALKNKYLHELLLKSNCTSEVELDNRIQATSLDYTIVIKHRNTPKIQTGCLDMYSQLTKQLP